MLDNSRLHQKFIATLLPPLAGRLTTLAIWRR